MAKENNNELFRLDGPLYRFFDIFYGLVVTGLMWIILCIPVFTAGAATTAAYYSMVKVVRMQQGKIMPEFFKSFKQNFTYATILNFIYCILLVIAIWNCAGMYQIWLTEQTSYYVMVTILWGVIAVLLLILSHWSYFFLSRFVAGPFAIIKMALWAMTRHFLSTVLILLLCVACVLVTYIWNPAVLILPGFYLWAASFLVEKVFHRYMPKTDHEPVYDENGDIVQTWYEVTAPTKEEKKKRPEEHLHRYRDYHKK